MKTYYKVKINGSLSTMCELREHLSYQKDDNSRDFLLSQDEINKEEINEYIDTCIIYSYDSEKDLFEEL